MNNKESRNQPSLFIRAYSVANSLIMTSIGLFSTSICLIGYILFALLIVKYISPGNIEFYNFWLPFTVIVWTPFLIWYLTKAVKYYKRFTSWKQDYLEQSYILILNTTIPEGNNMEERIFNIYKNIFPEVSYDYNETFPDFIPLLRYIIKKRLRKPEDRDVLKRSLTYNVNSYLLDMALRTESGYFVVKVFEDKIVTINDLKQLIQIVTGKFKNTFHRPFIFRLVCIAKKYDKQFEDRSALEQTMSNEFKTKFPIDLVVDEKVGYSVLWIGK